MILYIGTSQTFVYASALLSRMQYLFLFTHWRLVNGLVDAANNPNEESTIDPLDECITDIAGNAGTDGTDDDLPMSNGGSSTQRLLECVRHNCQELCTHARHFFVLNEGDWKVVLLSFYHQSREAR